MTAEEYFATSVEGDRTQLIDGRMIVNEPKLEHALIQTRLIAELSTPRLDVELELRRDDQLESPLLPGFAVAVERLFRRV
jgi:hypothetical protein